MFSLNWPHRQSFKTAVTAASRNPLAAIENRQRQPNNLTKQLHNAAPLKTIKVLSRLKFNKKSTKKEIDANNISSIQNFKLACFDDKINFVTSLEAKERTIEARRNDPKVIEEKAVGDAAMELRESIFGTKKPDPELVHPELLHPEITTTVHRKRLFKLYEEHEDQKIKNAVEKNSHPLFQWSKNYHDANYERAHTNAKKFIEICSNHDMEMALRQNVITLR